MAATKTIVISGIVIMAALFLTSAEAQSPPMMAPAPGPASMDCMSSLFNMSDCLSYVQSGSNLTRPDQACCPELAGLVDSQPICLCQLLGNTSSLGVDIDLNKALKLPSICGVDTPPVSLCSAVAGVPVGVPIPSEGPGSVPTPSEGPVPSAASPGSINNNGNGASSIAVIDISFFTGLAIAFFAAFF